MLLQYFRLDSFWFCNVSPFVCQNGICYVRIRDGFTWKWALCSRRGMVGICIFAPLGLQNGIQFFCVRSQSFGIQYEYLGFHPDRIFSECQKLFQIGKCIIRIWYHECWIESKSVRLHEHRQWFKHEEFVADGKQYYDLGHVSSR